MKTTYPKATKTVYPVICQIVNVIPHQFAAHHDSVRAAELTAHLKAGDITVADRVYTDFGFMSEIRRRKNLESEQKSDPNGGKELP
ncbi:MAG: hypothetical protein K6G91_05875 [Kiritimatiellae bacterium]|nr:hypothetical protein [Kiritimatiellia bacterium]